jgi:hypothetical protein
MPNKLRQKSLIWVDKHHLPLDCGIPSTPHPRCYFFCVGYTEKQENEGKNDTFAEQFNANEDTLNSLSIILWEKLLMFQPVMLQESKHTICLVDVLTRLRVNQHRLGEG